MAGGLSVFITNGVGMAVDVGVWVATGDFFGVAVDVCVCVATGAGFGVAVDVCVVTDDGFGVGSLDACERMHASGCR